MSDPEIARRCSACGVSVRQRAMYCPQCGNPIGDEPVAAARETVIDNAPTEALRPDPARRQPLSDGVRGRVEKLRRVSSVVLDQAAYDPSLRFLFVAAAFFLLFLVLLILSKVIG